MFRRVLQLVSLSCLAGLSLFYPIIESLDRWDSPEPSTDAEIQFIAVLTFVGVMFVLAHLLRTLALSAVLTGVIENLRRRASAAFQHLDPCFEALLAPSPPLPLRI